MKLIELDKWVGLNELISQFPKRKTQRHYLQNNDFLQIILTMVTEDTLKREEYLKDKGGWMITPNYVFTRPRFYFETERYTDKIENKHLEKHLEEQKEIQEVLDSRTWVDPVDTIIGYAYFDVKFQKQKGKADEYFDYEMMIQAPNNTFVSQYPEFDFERQEYYVSDWSPIESLDEKLENELIMLDDIETTGPLIIPTNKKLLKEINFKISYHE